MAKNIEQVTAQELLGMSKSEFDDLTFGLIQLDQEGVVRSYNAWEAALARRNANDVLGKNFFTDIAPCTNVEAFRGKLDYLAATGQKSYVFDYDFAFPWGTRKVRVRFVVESNDERWVLVTNVV